MIHRSESDPLLERVEKYYQSNGNLQDGIHGSPKHIGLDGAPRGGLLRSASFKSLNDAFLPSNPLRRPSTAEQVFSRIESLWCTRKFVSAFITKSEDNFLARGLSFLYEFAVCNLILVCVILTIFKIFGVEPLNWPFFHPYANRIERLPRWDLFIGWFCIMAAACSSGIYLRMWLILSSIAFTLYGFDLPVSLVLCIFQMTALLINLRKFWHKLIERINWIDFPDEFETAYRCCFFEFMTRSEFQRLADIAVIREERAGAFLRTKGDSVSALSFLVEGEVKVLDDELDVIDVHKKGSLLESPEWCQDNLNPVNGRFQVSLQCKTNIRFIKWPREPLVFLIARNSKLKAQLHAILGIQTSSILLKVRARRPFKFGNSNSLSSSMNASVRPIIIKRSHAPDSFENPNVQKMKSSLVRHQIE